MSKSQTSQKFNFKDPVSEDKKGLESYLDKVEFGLRKKINNTSTSSPIHLNFYVSWLFIFVLMLGLVGSGVYILAQIKQKNQEIALLKNSLGGGNVAGVSETNGQNVITADGFSLVFNQQPPKEFKQDRRTGQFEFLPNKNAIITRYMAKPTKGGQQIISGLEIYVSEYDNKLDRDSFDNKVAEKLGSRYELKSKDIILPKEFKVTKFQAKDDFENLSYYTTVTGDNYYVIKIYNQTAKYSEFVDLTRFTDIMLQSLYLN